MAEATPSHHQTSSIPERELAVRPMIHLEPQQAITLMKTDIRLAPDYLTPKATDPHTFLPTDCDPVHIPATDFFDRVRAAILHARSEHEGPIKPMIPKHSMILATVEREIKSSLQQLTPEQAQQEFWNTFGPELGTMPPNTQVETLGAARDIYAQRLELIMGIREFQRLGEREGITFTSRLMSLLPTEQQMQKARAVLQTLYQTTRAYISTIDTQALPSTKSLSDHLQEVQHLLWAD